MSIISEDDLEDPELKKAIERHASAMKYKIKGEEYTDNEKVVYGLNLTYSDAINYLLDAAGELIQTNALQGKNEEEVDKISNEVIIGKLNQEIKEKNSTGTITLEKKKDKWMITSIDEETRNAILMNSINVIEKKRLAKREEELNPKGEGKEYILNVIKIDEDGGVSSHWHGCWSSKWLFTHEEALEEKKKIEHLFDEVEILEHESQQVTIKAEIENAIKL